MAKRGIDISSHQGYIDLTALKSQIDFVIIRVGYGPKGSIDGKFKRNVDLCKDLGIPMGFYWYSYALDVEGAKKEANAFLKAIAPYTPEYGCWFDMEDADGYKKKNGMPSNSTLQDICYAFCEKVENAGYYTGIYASSSWFNHQLAGDKLARFDKWVAQWPTSLGKQKGLEVKADSRSDLSLWQFTSLGKFSGYDGGLDTNYAYKTFPNPKKSTTNNKITKPTTSTTTKNSIVKGSRVRFTGTRSYSGIHLAAWTHNDIFNVIEISGDRVVIGKGTAVTSAVNVKDCQLI